MPKMRAQREQNTRVLESFQVRSCRMERYEGSEHAFLDGMLFVLTFVWLSAFVCICFVCLSLFVSDGPSVCLCLPMSHGPSVCESLRFSGLCLPCACLVHVCVCVFLFCLLSVLGDFCSLCWLGLSCPILSWFVLPGSVCVSQSVLFFVVFTLPLVFSFVRLSFGYFVHYFFSLFLPSSKASSCSSFSHANLSNFPLKSSKPQHLQSCHKGTVPELETSKYVPG